MNFKETGFRPFYHHVCALELNDKLRELLKDCPEIDKSSHAVVYGYIDPENGLTLEVLGAGKQAPKYFYFKEPYENTRVFIRISEVAEVPFLWFEKLEPRFYKQYAPKIEELNRYNPAEDVEKSRGFDFLDACREPAFPDDIRVIFSKEGLKPEECWVRITGLEETRIVGTLLNQPYQNYGLNHGDTVRFFVTKGNGDQYICQAELESRKLSKEDLLDGVLLKRAVGDFCKNQNDDTFRFVLTVLRSSDVVVPYDAEIPQAYQAVFNEIKKEKQDYVSFINELKDRNLDGISLISDFLIEKNGHMFFPVFSTEEELNGQFENCVPLRTPFLEALNMASGEETEGIVLNAFSQAFVLQKDMFDAAAKTESLISSEENEVPLCEEPVTAIAAGDSGRFGDSQGIEIDVGKMDVFNYALYLNGVPPIRGIRVLNTTGDPVDGLKLHIYSDYELFSEMEADLPSIPSGKPVTLEDPELLINGNSLAGLTETVAATVTVELKKDGKSICGCRSQMQVLAYDQWQGGTSYQDLLPAFILPNHPVVSALLHDAADRLKRWGKEPSLEGYQSSDPNRVRDLMAAAYAAIQKKNIVYAEAPASFSVPGQRIRTPEIIMEQHLGTCMDMTLLYAACLEEIGLHPVLVLMKGHIFAGAWLRKRETEELFSSNVIIDNLEELKKRIDNGSDELTFIECTSMCSGKNISFEDSEKIAKWENLANSDEFQFAIDVKVARTHNVKPIPSRTRTQEKFNIQFEDAEESEITAAPKNLEISVVETAASSSNKITNKRDLWESKLLDLSQRNMLLNLPHNASVMPIMSSHIDELEDALADGHEFHLLSTPDWIADLRYTRTEADGTESKPIPWLSDIIQKLSVYEITKWPADTGFDYNEKFRQEFRNHRLYAFSSGKQLDRELTTIYRAARSSQQENGVSSLYLAIGLLRWFADPENDKPSYAPLILLPIEIIRKSANQGYALHARDEDPHFNTTLLEMLKQNFNLDIVGLDPLPTDSHGIDIRRVFAIVRSALFTLKDWDVVESCVIGNFSFAQFAMWNDLHTAGEMLEKSKVVRSLMKGHVDWDVSEPENLENENTYLPITVDATQLQAIRMAAHGMTFVLHGPPGTGKSQTITAMIANLMAQGKKVLFVAEKMAALSVVQKRLSSLGIGDFCLELHSDKANKKQVLSQLEKALAVMHPSHRTEYEEQLKNAAESRERLDEYSKHLHAVHTGGYSLRDLIDLYETVRDGEKMIRFDPFDAGQLSHAQIRRHLPLLSQLSAAGEAVGDIKNHPLSGVGLASYNGEVRIALRRDSVKYREMLKEIQMSSEKAAGVLNAPLPRSRREYVLLNQTIGLYFDLKNDEPELCDLLRGNGSEVETYFSAVSAQQNEENKLLRFWRKEFLTQDVRPYQAKYDAAGKKFFGKSSAMAAVVSELQPFAVQMLTYEMIPEKLQAVSAYQEHKQNFFSYYQSLSEGTRRILSIYPTQKSYRDAVASANQYWSKAASFPGGAETIRMIRNNSEIESVFADYLDSYKSTLEAEQQFNGLLKKEARSDASDWVEKETEFCQYLMEQPTSLKDWGLYNQIRQDCIEVGLKPVVDAYENGLGAGQLTNAYKKGFYYALINEIISTDDVLSSFSGVTFNESIQQFKRLDDNMLKETKNEIFYLLASHVPTSWDSPAVGMELNLLRKAIGSNARGLSIRALFERIPHVVRDLCPCMLMSPNSVAQYLSQDSNLFDVVIFDEASQLPTCKAVGALARAKNAVIVGDPKQMPPTSFFAGGGPEVDDLALDDLDSILDDALALGIPSQHLQWHYRSTHESLIAFSNNQFYDNKMYTFPSANDRERHVTAVFVEGLYKNGTNVKEAEAVVAEIVRRFHDPLQKKLSVGVVTFNIKQQALIENLLAKQFLSDPELDAWANNGEDPLFVKNLENVQGDERDVILFSIGYGPDERGRISMNFGPINQSGGGKRLNVAFSRSRVTMTIFSSIHSTDIRVTENSPEGLIAFRDFLRYAEGHELNPETSDSESARYSKAGILSSICGTIAAHGFQCVSNVGHSDFHVDIAVVDPFEPTKYLLGILLDGEGYRQTKNTRDREVAQISVLKNLGWTIYRIWTIDWWDNREKELRKLIDLIDNLKAESQKKYEAEMALKEAHKEEAKRRKEEEKALQEELEKQAAEVMADDQVAEQGEKTTQTDVESADPDESTSTVDENAIKGKIDSGETVTQPEKSVNESIKSISGKTASVTTSKTEGLSVIEPVPYVYADLPEMKMSSADYISADNKALIAELALKVLGAEAPILKESLMRKVMSSFGVSKSASVLDATEKALKAAKIKTTKQKGVVFCWAFGQDPKSYTGLRVCNERSGDEICPQELCNAVVYTLEKKGELGREELIKEASVVLGYKRLGKNLEAALTAGVQFARSSGAIIYVSGGRFKLP